MERKPTPSYLESRMFNSGEYRTLYVLFDSEQATTCPVVRQAILGHEDRGEGETSVKHLISNP